MTGIYIHIPYCVKKCGYCDFYSVCDLSTADAYTDSVCSRLDKLDCIADTLYFGGGTPSLLGGERIASIVCSAKGLLTHDAEITVEVNPGDDLHEFLPIVARAGVNRLSIGMQSHNDEELRLLTRRHTAAQVDSAIRIAKQSGIFNISLDVMLGIEGQTERTLDETLRFCSESGATHVSAYMLKIESGTPFETAEFRPDDDRQCELYGYAVDKLAELGFAQYEISNFCRDGMYSRHNMKYWTDEDYIGIGAAAHSYVDGKRLYYPRDIDSFIRGGSQVFDGMGGGFEETVMLRLRLKSGLDLNKLLRDYPEENKRIDSIIDLSKQLRATGLINYSDNVVSLTTDGFLVSNEIIARFIGNFD